MEITLIPFDFLETEPDVEYPVLIKFGSGPDTAWAQSAIKFSSKRNVWEYLYRALGGSFIEVIHSVHTGESTFLTFENHPDPLGSQTFIPYLSPELRVYNWSLEWYCPDSYKFPITEEMYF